MSKDDDHRRVIPEEDQGGDPVCWAHLVCPVCGRFAAEAEGSGQPAGSGQVTGTRRCPECGAELS